MSMVNGAAGRQRLAGLLDDPANRDLPLYRELAWLHKEYQKLERRFNKVAHISDLLQADLKKNQEALQLARQEAEAANIAKSRFLANMSHELRTPLAGIMGALEMLAAGETEPKKQGLLRISMDSSESLLRILNEILDLAKVESGRLDIRAEKFRLDRALSDAVGLFACNAKAGGVAMRYAPADDLPEFMWGDRDKLEQILRNLLGNAVKFTARGWVELRAALVPPAGTDQAGAPAMLRLEVEDSGIGIAAEFRPRLFENFTQADDSHARQFAGAGLGLAIVKRLVDLLGGSITVDSELGRGTVFTVELPFRPAPAALSAPVTQGESASTAGPPLSAGLDLPDELPPLRLLVVDDLSQTYDYLVFILPGQRLDYASSGVAALAALARDDYDAVLMDIQMPGMSGLEVTERLRATEAASERSRTPVIALTAHAMPEEVPALLAADMDGYVTKPIDRRQLYRELARVARLSPPTGAGRAATAAGQPAAVDKTLPVLDRAEIRSDFQDDLAVWRELAERYLGQTLPDDLQKLQDHLTAGELGEVVMLAHKMKGVMGILRAAALAARFQVLETAAAAGDAAEVARICDELPGGIEELHREIKLFGKER